MCSASVTYDATIDELRNFEHLVEETLFNDLKTHGIVKVHRASYEKELICGTRIQNM